MKKITGTFLESENLTLNSQVTQDIPPIWEAKHTKLSTFWIEFLQIFLIGPNIMAW